MSKTESRVRQAIGDIEGDLSVERSTSRRLCKRSDKGSNAQKFHYNRAVNMSIGLLRIQGHIITPNTLEAIEALERKECGIDL